MGIGAPVSQTVIGIGRPAGVFRGCGLARQASLAWIAMRNRQESDRSRRRVLHRRASCLPRGRRFVLRHVCFPERFQQTAGQFLSLQSAPQLTGVRSLTKSGSLVTDHLE
jgi:hypothetical protein